MQVCPSLVNKRTIYLLALSSMKRTYQQTRMLMEIRRFYIRCAQDLKTVLHWHKQSQQTYCFSFTITYFCQCETTLMVCFLPLPDRHTENSYRKRGPLMSLGKPSTGPLFSEQTPFRCLLDVGCRESSSAVAATMSSLSSSTSSSVSLSSSVDISSLSRRLRTESCHLKQNQLNIVRLSINAFKSGLSKVWDNQMVFFTVLQ